MAAMRILLVGALCACAVAQERCGYMTAIPREPRPPDLPPIDYEGLSWDERPLVPADAREDVCLDAYVPVGSSDGVQLLYVDEEREGDVPIARLNYDGEGTPTIDPSFSAGAFNNLRPELRREAGVWLLYITVRQNYEAGMTQYAFTVRTPGHSVAVMVNLQVVNIDDNHPMMDIFEACTIPELGEARLSECVYEVSDADGRLSTSQMTFRVEGERNADQLFYMHGTTLPDTWFTIHMTVGIRAPLDFEASRLHIFTVTAMDSLPNNHTATMMVQVENVEHRPPRWVETFAVQQFDEKTSQAFSLRAIDGDSGIDKPIYYRLETDPRDTFFTVETLASGEGGGVLHVAPIDRDALQREVFQLNVVAYKFDNESFATATPVVIIVDDVNDNKPEPLQPVYRLAMLEETAMTLDLADFGFHDIDLGQNAQYWVRLEAASPAGAEAGFYIAPEVGYQRQEFIVGTANHSLLDFEDLPFQHIELQVLATDMNNTEFVGKARLHIELLNWNDEEPIFAEPSVSVWLNETALAGTHVATLLATDRDIGDRVVHSLMGNAGEFLRIDPESGDIWVAADDAFDYHRQNVYFVQVRADDTLGAPFHTATAQLVLQLLDINNTPPTLRLPRGSPQVEENEPAGYQLTDAASAITASDPDSTAHLVFEIDWVSSYATKQGRETDSREYNGCMEIVTSYPDEGALGVATGHLVVREVRPNVTIDYEMFEVLYLTVRVRDLNTYIGDDFDESTLTITIIDMNDNPPVWAEGTLEQTFLVREMADSGVVVGSVLATDIDGPLYNQVRYSIEPRGDTPPELVEIDAVSGQMRVRTGQAIDADTPPRHHLYYTLLASDRCSQPEPADCPPDPTYHDTYGEIDIFITDINNKVPEPNYDRFNTTVYIYENATTGDDVTYVVAGDLDRDEMYHTVRYQINYAVNTRLLDFFKVELDSGRVFVEYTGPDVLDRDGDEPQHRLFFMLIDNLYMEGDGNRNQNDTEVLVVLLDVNDNAPELPDPSDISWSVSEDLAADMSLVPLLHAPDRDEPGTPNSLVGFGVPELRAVDRELDVPALLGVRSVSTDTGELVTALPLRGYWGTYSMRIHAFDHGEPQQHSFESYSLTVRPYNYHAPTFVFPAAGSLLRFARERALANSLLVTLDGELLRPLEAHDPDGLQAGTVTFSVVGDDEAEQYLDVSTNGAAHNQAALVLRQTVPDTTEFQVVLRATDGGTEPGALWADVAFTAVFVPTAGDPVFPAQTHTVAFIEKEAGLEERHELPRAEDPKNYRCRNDCYDIYYSIVEGNSGGHFMVEARSNVLSLTRALERGEARTHTLLVAAGNSPEPQAPPALASLLTVTVNVREADPRPEFSSELYAAGISTFDSINKDVLTVQATHSEGLDIEYHLDEESMQADGSLAGVAGAAFRLHPTSGVLTLAVQPTASMHGMFDFQVVATASDGSSARADIRVYLISSENRVTFIFVNTLEKVEESTEFIAATLSAGFGMRCVVERVVPAADADGLPRADYTELHAHFLRDDRPVPASEIEQMRSDTVLLTELQNILQTQLLLLADLHTGASPAPGGGSRALYALYALAALAALLAALCLLLLATYVVRTRTLRRQLDALAVTKYGSHESGLNRLGLAAPGTNKHAAEGSNPVWNEALRAPDFDAISDASDDSDLVGIEELPQFRSDYFPPTPDTLQLHDGAVATHNNHFGFQATPFSPRFANTQFGRP